MGNENKLILDISARLDELVKDVSAAKNRLKGLGAGVDSVDDKLGKGLKGWQAGFAKFGLAIQGVQQAFAILDRTVGSAVKTMAIFQTSMTEVNTLLNLTNNQFKALSKEVVNLSKTIPQTAEQLSKGLYQVVSAGVDTGDAMAFLEVSARGAVAGLTDTQTSVDAITGVINAYGLEASEAERISDIFFQTVKLGKTTFGELSPVMGQVLPVASAYNISFEQIAGAMATLTKRNINSARASTALATTINEMVKPASKAEKALRKLGYESGQSAVDQLGLQGAIIALTESGANMAEIFGQESLKAVLGLGNSAESTTADLDAMNESAGATNTAFELMNGTLENQSLIMKNQLEALYLSFGETLIPTWTQALVNLNAVLSNQGAIQNILANAETGAIGKLEARITALDLLNGKYKETSKNDVDQLAFLMKYEDELNALGIGVTHYSQLQETMNQADKESIELAKTIGALRKQEVKDLEASEEKKASLAKKEGSRKLQGEETAIRGYHTELELIELIDHAKEDSATKEEALLMLLQGGWKDYLKQKALDWINAKQLEMLGSLAVIWAGGGATLGASLPVALPMYGTGLVALEGARALITAFAEGGRIDSPTLALMGEKGTEFVAPETKFEKYSHDTLTPMIMDQVQSKLAKDGGSGAMSSGLSDVKKSIDSLKNMVAKPMSVVNGRQIQVINARMMRGSLV